MVNEGNVPEGRALTYGEDAVGLTFNPGGNPHVTKIKKLYAEVIDLLNDKRHALKTQKHLKDIESGEKIRLYSVAITEAQTAQMWAVKGITK